MAAMVTACNAGQREMCEHAGVVFRDGQAGLSADPERALYYFELACMADLGSACSEAVPLVGEDEPARIAWLEAGACKSGDDEACQRGLSLLDPESDATQWLYARLAARVCELGGAAACAGLGNALRLGRGARRDRERALASYARACTSEASEGCRGVRTLCQEGALDACMRLARACDSDVVAACAEMPPREAAE